tara:strand:- start:5492 stop:6124 length:633 start_codon:yes stop_codon:yes gene_type:complete
MAVYKVTFKQLLDNYAVLTLLTDSDIEVGQSITVASVDATFNGTYTVYALPQYLYTGTDTQGNLLFDGQVPIANQVLFAKTASDVSRVATATGTVTWTVACTWIDDDMIQEYVGLTSVTAEDASLLVTCAAAANAFAYRRRLEAGYLSDSQTTVPSGDVLLGTIMIGAAYFRQRGSFNTIASFDGMGIAPSNGVTPMIMQLLGINRPQVA